MDRELAGDGHPGCGFAPASPAKRSPFLLGGTSPNSRVLAGGEGPFEALEPDVALHANRPCGLDLISCGARRPDREEELGVLVLAPGSVNPVHLTPPVPGRAAYRTPNREIVIAFTKLPI